ncbi:hypothetical protein MD484_g144, partial [Candolleomyces efflorescens]
MSDPRFARLKTDPRFRRPKKRQNKVVVDERFKSVLKQEKKKDSSGRVDKYGRKLSTTHGEDNLKRFYRLEEDADEGEAPKLPDYARGEALMESSDEDEGDNKEDDNESDTGGIVRLGYDSDASEGDEEHLAEIDLDEDNFADLDAQAAAYAKEQAERSDEEEQEEQRTRRLAVVNLDWDHVRAAHLYKIFSSLVSPTAPLASSKKKHPNNAKRSLKETPQVNVVRGKVLSVVVYPSDFGKERMAREEKEGPPMEIFKKKKDSEEITEKSLYETGGEDQVDDSALRKYQLDRLRYYYAIVTCDTTEAASHVYDELHGTELERSANMFDLSFVPDEMTFDNEPRDEATDIEGTSAKGIDFVTAVIDLASLLLHVHSDTLQALRHSKVKLTWDEDDTERNKVTRRNLTRQEIDEGDFRAYIASSSGSESEGESSKPRKNNKADRDKLRALLLGGNEEAMPEGWGDDNHDDVDMEITFTPGLLGKLNDEDETTLEKYQRKMREKRKKRKEEVKDKSTGKGKEREVEDDFFEGESEEEGDASDSGRHHTASKGKKKKGGEKQTAEVNGRGQEATTEELALLVSSNNPDADPKHFDFKAVLKAEKGGKRKKRGKKEKHGEDETQQDFVLDVQDERFQVLHEDHQFAIDPSNPHFKKTKGMSALLDERRKRNQNRNTEQDSSKLAHSITSGPSNPSLQKLVESVKRKSAEAQTQGQGKRRKL